MSEELPACGLYRTGVSLSGAEEAVPGGVLVFFHNHSDQGPPLLLLPSENSNNRWVFQKHGRHVEDPGFLRELVPLKEQGLYVISGSHLHVSREEILAERTLVQLGYNRKGDSILFVGRFADNTIEFPTSGYRFESVGVQEHLAKVNFSVPTRTPAEQRTLH